MDVEDIVDFAISGDAANLKAAVDEVMIDKINRAIEVKKFELVNRTFNGIDPDEEVEETQEDETEDNE